MDLVSSGADISIMEGADGGWLVVVVDREGERHEVQMPVAQDEAAREELVWLGRSLLTPVTAPLAIEVPSPRNEPGTVSRPPVPQVPTGADPARRWGLGLVVGEPMGLTGKVMLARDRSRALDIAVGSPDLGWRWSAHADYLWLPRVTRLGSADLFAHVGLGAAAEVKRWEDYATVQNRPRAGLRVPIGVDLWVPAARLEAFAELGSTLLPAPRRELRLGGALGARYFF